MPGYSQATLDRMSDEKKKRLKISRGIRKNWTYTRKSGKFTVQAVLDEETFQQVADFSKRQETSMARAIALLIEWGLEADAG